MSVMRKEEWLSRRRADAYARGLTRKERADREWIMARALLSGTPPLFHTLRMARLDAALLDEYPLETDDCELLVGRFATPAPLNAEQKETVARYRLFRKECGLLGGFTKASTGHRVVDYEKLLRLGVEGLLSEIDARERALPRCAADTPEKRAFYQAVRLTLEAFGRFAARWRALLLEKAITADPARSAQLRAMAETFGRAPQKPCVHFREALQTMWLMQFALALTDDYSLSGRADQYLFPYYERDLADGVIDESEALTLIEEFYFKNNEIYGNWSVSLMIGGVDGEGKPAWNALSRLFLLAMDSVRLINPSVAVAYTKDMPEELLDLSVGMLARGYARPAFFNDALILEGLIRAGVSPRDARLYIHSNCVEITPIAASNIRVATPYVNLALAFRRALASDYADFTAFYDAMKREMEGEIRAGVEEALAKEAAMARYASAPLSSALLNDCLALGVDAGNGGARYNFMYPCFPGFITVVDGLAAIERAVFEKREMSLRHLAECLESDFAGAERERLYLLNQCPKFGNGDERADRIARELNAWLVDVLSEYRTALGGGLFPSYFAWTRHGRMGAATPATPDGRHAGVALSECLGPVPGRDAEGPMGVLRSVCSIDQRGGIGGIATNLRFQRDFLEREKGREAFKRFIRAFMENGGFELQINVVSQSDLAEAKKHPEQYRTLMVRVAGFSDYFVALDPEIQEEIMRRTEHEGGGA